MIGEDSSYSEAYERLRDTWAKKSKRAIEKEIDSWRRYMQRHTQAYAWHGKGITPPGNLADGDKLSALREALSIRECSDEATLAAAPSQEGES